MRTVGPTVDPPWWNFIRQMVMFLMGVGLILWWVVERAADKFAILQLLTGLILLGLVPIDRLLGRIGLGGSPTQAPQSPQPPVENPPPTP